MSAEAVTASRAEQLVMQFEAINDEVIATVEGCTDAQWQRRCVDEERTVGVVAHHIGTVHGDFIGLIRGLAGGRMLPPRVSMDVVDQSNAQHARDYATVEKSEALEVLRTQGAALAERLRGLEDGQLQRIAGVFGEQELSVAQVVELIVLGHPREHLASVRATLAA